MEGGGLSAAIFVMTLGRRVLLLTLQMGGSTHRNEVVRKERKRRRKKNQEKDRRSRSRSEARSEKKKNVMKEVKVLLF